MPSKFRDRREAGQYLAEELRPRLAGRDPVVLALPRGGVPVAFEVARELHAPLDILIVRKLGIPGHEELAMGAIASGGVVLRDARVIGQLRISPDQVNEVIGRETQELARRERTYRHGREMVELRGRTVVLVDDGLATGSSMAAAVAAVRQHGPAAVVVAVPVAPPSTCESLRRIADDCICARTPEPFWGVGQWYDDFNQTSDEEVGALLDAAAQAPARVAHSA